MILVESLRGTARDAGVYRVLSGVAVEPVTRALGEQAGQLIGSANLGSGHAVDAMLVATALAEERPVVIATSDPKDLTALMGGERRVSIVAANEIT